MPKTKKTNIYDQITHFAYETSIHSRTPRSGLWFLGSGHQSVAEHIFHTAMIAYALARLVPAADRHKVVMMALFHDLGEGRTSDHNYVHQRYGRLAESEAVSDIAQSVPFGSEILDLFEEFERKETLEAKLVRDADQLEFISTLRAEEVKGNQKARKWLPPVLARLKTAVGKKLGRALMKTHPDAWWFDVKDQWFVGREEKDRRWRKK